MCRLLSYGVKPWIKTSITLAFLGVLCWPTLLRAESLQPQPFLAMHGDPKLPANYSSFSYVNPDAPKGGTLKLGVVGSFDSLNPFIVRGTVPQAPAFSLFSSAAVYESLMARSWDEPFTLYGLLAQTVEVPEDRSFIIFNLNPAAHFSDGTSVTADDVLFSFETLRDQGRPNHRTYYKKVARAQKLSDKRVRFDFKKQDNGTWDNEMPLIIGLMPILPRHDWQDRPFNQTTLRPPIASGPYLITKVDVGRSLTLTRDKDYWGRALPAQKGLFNFDEVRIDFYRDDSIALQAFKAHAYDLRRELDPKKWAKGYDGPALADNRMALEKFPHHRTESLRAFIFNTRHALLNDPTLRRAMNLAFDFDWINTALFQEAYTRANSYFPNSELAAGSKAPEGLERDVLLRYKDKLPASVFETPFSLSDNTRDGARRVALLEAATMLKNAGYTLKEGQLYAPKGQPLAFEIMLSDPTEEKVALAWARELDRLGIKLNVRTVDSAQYQERLNSFNYDITSGRWFNSLSPGNEQTFFWSCNAAKQQGSRNYAGICDPVVDALAAAIPAARTREDLVATTRALDRVLMAGNYVVPLYYLSADQIAFWKEGLAHPSTIPLYGPIIESWWATPLDQ
ncbi:MAG: extracellular solute-binding protein [Alphaproteobacteria bacterium]|nr:extracellular solute-binding protein [Alphaproteobacteria bacterium]